MRNLATSMMVLLIGLATSAASTADEPPLYRIELVVFVNTGSATAEESWPQPQGLAYPEHWKILDADELFATADGDEAGFDPLGEAAQDSAGQPTDGDHPAAPETPEPDDSDAQQAWRSLPESDWLLADSAARIARSGRYQVVLHQAWLQPLGNREQSPALVLAGGEQFGNHHELEGYLSLRQERFIHLDAELWLSRFRFGSGLEATLFSPLPTPPQLIRQTSWSNWFGDEGRGEAGDPVEPVSDESSARTAYPSPEHLPETGRDGTWPQSIGTTPGFGHNTGFGTMASFDSNYVPSQIFVLKQRQRVEPDQLTYLDHPLMGALLLVKPVATDTTP